MGRARQPALLCRSEARQPTWHRLRRPAEDRIACSSPTTTTTTWTWTRSSRLWRRFAPRIVAPLGNDTILRAAVPGIAADAVDWDATVDLGGGVAVHVEPSQHWSARGALDRSHALWASFVLRTGGRKLYCVGDTGFGDGATFARVRQRHPGLAAALLPIGAYEPRWFMGASHMNPDDAVQALELCGAAQALGHHWGTFRLTNEAVDQPALDLAAALTARGIAPERFAALRPGEVRMLA